MDDEDVLSRIMPAFRVDRETGAVEVNVPLLLECAGWEDTAENRDAMVEMCVGACKQSAPSATRLVAQRATVTRKGIWLFGQHYWAPELVGLRGRVVKVLYQDDDPSKITVEKGAIKFQAVPIAQVGGQG